MDLIALIYLVFGSGIFRFFAVLLGGMLVVLSIGLNGIHFNIVTVGGAVIVVLLLIRAVQKWRRK